jgi:flagellar motility protein MotE (MotC chaperone)
MFFIIDCTMNPINVALIAELMDNFVLCENAALYEEAEDLRESAHMAQSQLYFTELQLQQSENECQRLRELNDHLETSIRFHVQRYERLMRLVENLGRSEPSTSDEEMLTGQYEV